MASSVSQLQNVLQNWSLGFASTTGTLKEIAMFRFGSLSISLSLFLSLSLSLNVLYGYTILGTLSVCLFLSFSLSLTISLSFSISLPLSLSFFLSLSLFLLPETFSKLILPKYEPFKLTIRLNR